MSSRFGADDGDSRQVDNVQSIRSQDSERPILGPATNLETLTDEELASHLQAGYPEALTVIFEKYSGMVFGIARRMLRDDGEAEEAVQQVFLDMYRAIGQFDPKKASYKTWLLQFAYHRAINRKHHLEANGFYAAEEFHEDLLPAELYEGTGRPLQLSFQELVHLVEQLLSTIPPKQRRTIELTFFQGFTAEEIAVQTGETPAVVRHNLYRGLDKLRLTLAHNKQLSETGKARKEVEGVSFAYSPRSL
jgi:RNA polymerase sigma-70 factor (ECF subfamily)